MGFLYMLEGLRNPVLDKLFAVLTYLGGEIVFVALAVIVYWCVSKKSGYYIIAAGVGGTVINQVLKIFCAVPRPWVRDPNFTIVESARAEATGYSFPSGHSQNSAVSMGGLAMSVKKTWLRWLCWVLVALVCLSRMYLGVHTPADVLVGLGTGLVLVFGLWPLFQASEEKPGIITAVYAVITAVALAGVLFVQLHAWPADIDQENLAEAGKNTYTMLGIAAAVLVAAPIERRYIDFKTEAPLKVQVLKCALGLALVVGLRVALKALLKVLMGGNPAADAVRYFIIVVFAMLVWPLTFRRFSGEGK